MGGRGEGVWGEVGGGGGAREDGGISSEGHSRRLASKLLISNYVISTNYSLSGSDTHTHTHNPGLWSLNHLPVTVDATTETNTH